MRRPLEVAVGPAVVATPDTPFLFIVGRGRSGTTLLRAMFDSHPDMAIPPESHFIVPLGQHGRYQRPTGFDSELFLSHLRPTGVRRWGLPEDLIRSALGSSEPATYPEAVRVVFACYAAHHGKRRYGDKTPVNVRNIAPLAEMFREARFIHIVRDGRDVTQSILSVDWGVQTVAESAVYWKLSVEQARRDGEKLGPSRYREVRYEDLVKDPDSTLRALCDFADLLFDPLMLRYYERADEVRKGTNIVSHRNIERPPTKTRDWRQEMQPGDIALFEALAGDTIADFGYHRALRSIPFAVRIRAWSARTRIGVRRVSRRASKAYHRARSRRSRTRLRE